MESGSVWKEARLSEQKQTVVPLITGKGKKKRKKGISKAEIKRRNLDKFDDKPGPLLDGVTSKNDLFSQVSKLTREGFLYDDKPGVLSLRTDHPAVSTLGAEGYLKVLYLVRYCGYKSSWDLFPKGIRCSERDRQMHNACRGNLSNRLDALRSFHETFHGFITGVHSDLYHDGFAVFDTCSTALTNVSLDSAHGGD